MPDRQRAPVRALVGGIAIGLLLATLAGVLLVGPLILAHKDVAGLSHFYGVTAVNHTSQASAPQSLPTANPRNLVPGRERRLPNIGLYAYTGSCAQCHGPNGDGKGTLGGATLPLSTDLTGSETRGKSDTQLFWIIKNGISFTAMPGYGEAYSDNDLVALVQYLRTLQNGQAQPIDIPAPTAEQLAVADPNSSDPDRRGAAVYFAQGCNQCHGAIGNAPGDLQMQDIGDAQETVRRGRPGMPAFSPNQINNAQLTDLIAYLKSLPSPEEDEG